MIFFLKSDFFPDKNNNKRALFYENMVTNGLQARDKEIKCGVSKRRESLTK